MVKVIAENMDLASLAPLFSDIEYDTVHNDFQLIAMWLFKHYWETFFSNIQRQTLL